MPVNLDCACAADNGRRIEGHGIYAGMSVAVGNDEANRSGVAVAMDVAN